MRARTFRSGRPLLVVLALLIGRSVLLGASGLEVFVPSNSVWKYFAEGREPSPNWSSLEYSDSAWPQGVAQFGYGDGDEATVLSFGPDPDARYSTYYFRRTVVVPDPAAFNQVVLRLLRDDGAAVYLNGHEIFRDNLPAGRLGYETLASTNVVGEAERVYQTVRVRTENWLERTNVIAVEVHQANLQSVDLGFDLEFSLTDGVDRVRGPYLQLGRTNGATIRWRTAQPSDSLVRCGTSPDQMTMTFARTSAVTNHVVDCTGLEPDTRYFYTIGSSTAGDLRPVFTFVTHPMRPKPTRIWAIGDAGTGTIWQRAVRDAYRRFAGGRPTDVWLMLGDNAYGVGSDDDYQRAVFEVYPDMLSSTFLWPTIGNHDVALAAGGGTLAFLDIFTLPAQGEAGGAASGTERFYSFDYANIHFICLDATSANRSTDGPMATWLRADLSTTTADWIIAYWHHPPYSAGSHNSDAEVELIEMRQNMLPILEAHGVDLVLCGHSHSYERSFLLNGHYGPSTSLTSAMVLDSGDGRERGTGPYWKLINQPDPGTVYVVAGSSGQTSGGALNHPAMAVSHDLLGSVVLDIDGPHLDAIFLRENGQVDDAFKMVKSEFRPPLTVSNVRVEDGRVHLAWKSKPGGTYRVEMRLGFENPIWVWAGNEQIATGATAFWSAPLDPLNGEVFFRVIEVRGSPP